MTDARVLGLPPGRCILEAHGWEKGVLPVVTMSSAADDAAAVYGEAGGWAGVGLCASARDAVRAVIATTRGTRTPSSARNETGATGIGGVSDEGQLDGGGGGAAGVLGR